MHLAPHPIHNWYQVLVHHFQLWFQGQADQVIWYMLDIPKIPSRNLLCQANQTKQF